MNPKISFLALLKAVNLSDQTFYPKDKKELGEDMIGTINSELIKKIYIKWEQAREAHWENHRQIGELAEKTLILVSERNTQFENLKKKHALLANQEKFYEQLFWAMVRLEIPTPYNTIGIREKWQVVGIIADGGKDENYLPDDLPLSAELEKITLDGDDSLAQKSINEGEEIIGEIADEFLQKIFIIMDRTVENIPEIQRQAQTVDKAKIKKAEKEKKLAELKKTLIALLNKIEQLTDIFWSATQLACPDQFDESLGIRQGWQIVKMPKPLTNPRKDMFLSLITESVFDLMEGERRREKGAGIHIIEIGFGL